MTKENTGYWKLKEEALDCTLQKSLWKKLWTSRKRNCGKKKNEHPRILTATLQDWKFPYS
jgi:hypothetical protein